jgi:hypothetical protein
MDYLLIIFIIILLGFLFYYLFNYNDLNYTHDYVRVKAVYNTDVAKKEDNEVKEYEYIQQFNETTASKEPINPNSVGFCPKAKEEKGALPIANINVNFLL